MSIRVSEVFAPMHTRDWLIALVAALPACHADYVCSIQGDCDSQGQDLVCVPDNDGWGHCVKAVFVYGPTPDGGVASVSQETLDGGADAGGDAGLVSGQSDAGEDAGAVDAGGADAGEDAGLDAGAADGAEDAGVEDAGEADAGAVDAGDAGDDAGIFDAGDDAGT